MEHEILSEKQRVLIDHLPLEILDAFYLTGGTALSAFYLGHRLSEDMDFFTDAEENMPPLEFLTAALYNLPGAKGIHHQRLFDQRIFSVAFTDGDTLKLEFTTYPFRSIEDRKRWGTLTVDSMLNIITGKLFAMTDRFDPKDFVDLYIAIRRYSLGLSGLISRTEERFGVRGLSYVVPERLLMAGRITRADLPKMLVEVDVDRLKTFFFEQCAAIVKMPRAT